MIKKLLPEKIRSYLQLTRPANIVTACTDILAGFAAATAFVTTYTAYFFISTHFVDLLLLLLATIGLYGGGIVFNDVFDAELDKIERPERAIPSGAISQKNAAIFGALLFAMAIMAASLVSFFSFGLAFIIMLLCLSYNAASKHHAILGPLNMGLCRGANLLLGASVIPYAVTAIWFVPFISVVYVATITLISRSEVHGGNRTILKIAFALDLLIITAIAMLSLSSHFYLLRAIPFLILLAAQILWPLQQAIRSPQPPQIRASVKSAVIAIIILDAALVAGFTGLLFGLIVLACLPISLFLAKKFAVT